MSAELHARNAGPSAEKTALSPPIAPVPPAPPPTLGSLEAPSASHLVESRWVPLIPGAQAIPSGVSTRSGAFLMAATRDEPGLRPGPRAPEPDLEVRSALLTCVEALSPYLEPGWSHCQEHPGCLAVQEASRALWGGASAPSASAGAPALSPRANTPPDPANLPQPGSEEGPEPPSMNRPVAFRGSL